jgi:hypothetical protein
MLQLRIHFSPQPVAILPAIDRVIKGEIPIIIGFWG